MRRKGFKMTCDPLTITEAITPFGVSNDVFFEGNNQTERIATDIFDNDFNACMDKKWIN